MAQQTLRFRLSGEPVTWKRPVTVRPHVVYNPSAGHQRILQNELRAQMDVPMLTGALRVELTFWFQRPALHYIDGFILRDDADHWYMRKADLDNLSKEVLDSMTGVVYQDDHQVVSLSAHMCYSNSKVITSAAQFSTLALCSVWVRASLRRARTIMSIKCLPMGSDLLTIGTPRAMQRLHTILSMSSRMSLYH